MDPKLRALVATAEGSDWTEDSNSTKHSRFLVELDRRGVFLRLGRVEAYLCTEAEGAWSFFREPGGFDAQVWRLHLVVGTAPR